MKPENKEPDNCIGYCCRSVSGLLLLVVCIKVFGSHCQRKNRIGQRIAKIYLNEELLKLKQSSCGYEPNSKSADMITFS
jgi:hypothetical protein